MGWARRAWACGHGTRAGITRMVAPPVLFAGAGEATVRIWQGREPDHSRTWEAAEMGREVGTTAWPRGDVRRKPWGDGSLL